MTLFHRPNTVTVSGQSVIVTLLPFPTSVILTEVICRKCTYPSLFFTVDFVGSRRRDRTSSRHSLRRNSHSHDDSRHFTSIIHDYSISFVVVIIGFGFVHSLYSFALPPSVPTSICQLCKSTSGLGPRLRRNTAAQAQQRLSEQLIYHR